MNRATYSIVFPYLTDSQSQESTMFMALYSKPLDLHRRSIYKLRSNNEKNAYSKYQIEGHSWMTQPKAMKCGAWRGWPPPCTWLRVAPSLYACSLPHHKYPAIMTPSIPPNSNKLIRHTVPFECLTHYSCKLYLSDVLPSLI